MNLEDVLWEDFDKEFWDQFDKEFIKRIREEGEKEMREKDCNCNDTCGCEICCPDPIDENNMGKVANQGLTRDDSSTATRLLDKNWSPLIVRKYQMEGWPLFISLICDANLNDLDKVVYELSQQAKEKGFISGRIQGVRNYCGFLSDGLKDYYNNVKQGCVEGIAVLWYVDKMFCSSLYGDFMVHAPCKAELFAIIQTLPHI